MTTTKTPPLTLSDIAYREMLSCVISRLHQHARTLEEHNCDRKPTFVAAIKNTSQELSVLDPRNHPGSILSGFRQFSRIWKENNPNVSFFPRDVLLDVRAYLSHVDQTLELLDALCKDPYAATIEESE